MFKRVRKLLANRRATVSNLEILYVPGFDSEQDLTDQYFRILWYLHPLLRHGASVHLPTRIERIPPIEMPAYFDPELSRFAPAFRGALHLFPDDSVDAWEERVARAAVVMQWKKDFDHRADRILSAMTRAIQNKKSWLIDKDDSQYEGSFYLKFSHDANPRRKADLADSRRKFDLLARRLEGQRRGYVFGTGPSLAKAMELDFSGGVTIACNSMVKNRPLLAHLKPQVLVIGDPIFHAGCSSYAGEFRHHLMKALEDHDTYLIVPFRDYKLYLENLPSGFEERIIGIPLEHLPDVNLDLRTSFRVKSIGNILTLFLIPLAATFFKEIGILGCDGRRIEENKYFWSHDPSSQLNDQMTLIQACHPAFFKIDYNDYYLTHCENLESWLSAVEQKGITVSNLSPSFIPALQRRTT